MKASEVATEGINLPTTIGNIQLKVTSPTHIYMESPRGTTVTIRGVHYRFSLHLNLYDGKWSRPRNDAGREETYYLTLTKVKPDGSSFWPKDDGASESAKDKAYEVVAGRVNEWVQTQDAKIVLAATGVTKAENAHDAAKATVERLTAELKAAKKAVEDAEEGVVAARHVFIAAQRGLK